MKLLLPFFLFSILLVFSSCDALTETEPEIPEQVEGLRPVYFEGNPTEINFMPPQSISRLGKIYYKAPYIFMNDVLKGIHILDNTDPANPQKIGFINIPGNRDISIKGNYMYVDNYKDLVCLDISDYNNLREVSRVEGLYDADYSIFPDNYTGYFECVDPNKGNIVSWETGILIQPECWR